VFQKVADHFLTRMIRYNQLLRRRSTMSNFTTNTATVSCSGSVGSASSTYLAMTNSTITASNNGMATIMDYVPFSNIMPFGQCNLSSNPMVAAATAAASGVHTPVTCIPATAAPWTSGSSTVMVNNLPALTDDSTCMCTWGGTISIKDAGQSTVTD
jgi:hypothetical protein